jgi:hypothetical protein
MHGDANALKAQSFLRRVSSRQKGLWQKIESDQGLEEKPPANFGLDTPDATATAGGQSGTTGGGVASAQAIIATCEAEWPQFSGDCSGFVRNVASRFGVALAGLANDIVDEIRQADWRRLADGKAAKDAADSGDLVIGGLRGDEQTNPDEHGHAVVVVSGPLDSIHRAYPSAYWAASGAWAQRTRR